MLTFARAISVLAVAVCFGAGCQNKDLEVVRSRSARPFFPVELDENPEGALGLLACDDWRITSDAMVCPEYRLDVLSGASNEPSVGTLLLRFRGGRLYDGSWSRQERWEFTSLSGSVFFLDKRIRQALRRPIYDNIDESSSETELSEAIRRGEFHERWAVGEEGVLFLWVGLDGEGRHTLAVQLRAIPNYLRVINPGDAE